MGNKGISSLKSRTMLSKTWIDTELQEGAQNWRNSKVSGLWLDVIADKVFHCKTFHHKHLPSMGLLLETLQWRVVENGMCYFGMRWCSSIRGLRTRCSLPKTCMRQVEPLWLAGLWWPKSTTENGPYMHAGSPGYIWQQTQRVTWYTACFSQN